MELIAVDALPDNLRRYTSGLHACVREALVEFVADHRDRRADYTSRTEASIIHDLMVKHAKARFPSYALKQNLFVILLGYDYLIKLKRLDRHLRTSRIPTNLSLQFEDQCQLTLFDDLDRWNLYLGYQVDPIEVLKSRIWLVQPDGHGIRFAAELTSESSNVVEFAPAQETTARRIVPKVASIAKAVVNVA